MKFRITMEYDLDDSDPATEQHDWIKGNVTFQDIWYLFEEGSNGYRVQFQALDADDDEIHGGDDRWPETLRE